MEKTIGKYFQGDRIMWTVIFLLALISIPAVYSAAGNLAFSLRDGDTGYFLIRQLSFVSLGIITVYIFHKIPFKVYIGLSKILLPIAVILLFLTLFFGTSENEAKRWLPIAFGFKLQTSDIARIALIMYVAGILAKNHKDEEKFNKSVKKTIITTLLVSALIMPFNLSTALLLLITIAGVMFVARVKMKKIFLMAGIAIAGGALYIILSLAFGLPGRTHTWMNRIKPYFGIENTEKTADLTYQSDIAKMAIVDGGLTGEGPGNGTMKYVFPQAHSDYIYAFTIEEYGLIAGVLILLLYVVFFYRGISIAKKAQRTFPMILALGLTLTIVLQAFINMSVSVGLLPVTGQTLPFVSMGGTSMLVTGFAFGVLLNISRINSKEKQIKT